VNQGQRGTISRLLILVVAAAGVFLSQASAEIENISPLDLHKLEGEFKAGKPISARDLSKLSGAKWSCDMYGARTRLQVERNVKLYSFHSASGGRIKNKNAPFAGAYKIDGESLTSAQAGIQDSIRWRTPGRELITEIRVVSDMRVDFGEGPGPATVIAYSRCHSVM